MGQCPNISPVLFRSPLPACPSGLQCASPQLFHRLWISRLVERTWGGSQRPLPPHWPAYPVNHRIRGILPSSSPLTWSRTGVKVDRPTHGRSQVRAQAQPRHVPPKGDRRFPSQRSGRQGAHPFRIPAAKPGLPSLGLPSLGPGISFGQPKRTCLHRTRQLPLSSRIRPSRPPLRNHSDLA